MRLHEALQRAGRASDDPARRVEQAAFQLVVGHTGAVLLSAYRLAVNAERDLGEERARDAADPLGAHEVRVGGSLEHGRPALLEEYPGVDVALDDGVELGLGALQLGRRRRQRLLLGEDERVGARVEAVVGKKPEREGAPDALVGRRQVRDARPEGKKRLLAEGFVHRVPEPVVGAGTRGQRQSARKEGIGPLVAQQEGEQLLLAVHHARGQRRRGVLAEDVVADDGRHGAPLARDAYLASIPLCPPGRGPASLAPLGRPAFSRATMSSAYRLPTVPAVKMQAAYLYRYRSAIAYIKLPVSSV